MSSLEDRLWDLEREVYAAERGALSMERALDKCDEEKHLLMKQLRNLKKSINDLCDYAEATPDQYPFHRLMAQLRALAAK